MVVLVTVVVVVTGTAVLLTEDETGVSVPTAGELLASNVVNAASVEGFVNRVERVAGEVESNWAKVETLLPPTGTDDRVVTGDDDGVIIVVVGLLRALGCSDDDGVAG